MPTRVARSVLIGHAGHPEIVGTMGRINGRVHLISTPEEVARLKVADPDKLAFITQTTLSVDDTRAVIEALKVRFPTIVGPDTKDICYATQNRQRAARELAKIVDVVLVVGAPNSSNSNRLREIAAESGVPSYLIEDARALDPSWIENARAVGITAGASAPAELVEEVIDRLARADGSRAIGAARRHRERPLPDAYATRRRRRLRPAPPQTRDEVSPCQFRCAKRFGSAPTLLLSTCKGVRRYPLVLMLEPLFRCNLACAGCGKIDYPDAILNQRLSVDECVASGG